MIDRSGFESVCALLKTISPKRNPQIDADTLYAAFGSANALFSASPKLLMSAGMSSSEASLIGRMAELTRYSGRNSASAPMINTLSVAARYLVESLSSLSEERFCLLCLHQKGYLIKDVVLQNGTDDTALFSLRALLSEVVKIKPYAVILSHNHPRHTLHPSSEDIACTREALRALTVLGIPMLDHIIVAGKQAVSIRDNGFIPAELWLDQKPSCALLRNWLANA